MSTVLTVSQVNMFLKSLIEGDGRLKNVMISGEISNFTNHYKSGHLYFSLKDSGGVIKAVMFAESARMLRFMPKDGMKVIVAGRVSVYEATGQYQIYVRSMQPDGVGALNLAYEQLKEKLHKEGLFDKSNPIPAYPERVAVITSPTGAAVQDIKSVLARRWPVAQVIMFPVAVQGELAEGQLTKAVKTVNEYDAADVIIIGRGGGSIEDLWAFNSEKLAREIYASHIPVISAVGHETDFTICDFVSDLRAPTPSAAAELAVPNIYEEMDRVEALYMSMKALVLDLIDDARMYIDSLTSSPAMKEPESGLLKIRKELEYLESKLILLQKNKLSYANAQVARFSGMLHELSPLKILSRGYSVIQNNKGEFITSAEKLNRGDKVKARLSDGTAEFTVDSVIIDKENDNA